MDEALDKLQTLRAGARITHFDLLRGFFVLLALYQHYGGYFNYWMVYYFRESAETIALYYSSFADYQGVRLPMDTISHHFATFFIPWVSQVYLTLAAFNLARYKGDDFNKRFPMKLKIYGVLFIFFFLENFTVAINLGNALSFYPIMAWMVILSAIAVVFRYLGPIGVALLGLLTFTRFLMPEVYLSDQFASFAQYWVHPDFEYEARLEYYSASGCMGFLLGYCFYHRPDIRLIFKLSFVLGVLLMIPWIIWGEPYIVQRLDVYAGEHDLAKDFLGTLYILGTQMLFLMSFLWLEARGVFIKIPLISWVGFYSLFVFGFHRIFFIHIAGPLWAYVLGVWLELPPRNSTLDIWIIIFCYLALCWATLKIRFLRMMDRD